MFRLTIQILWYVQQEFVVLRSDQTSEETLRNCVCYGCGDKIFNFSNKMWENFEFSSDGRTDCRMQTYKNWLYLTFQKRWAHCELFISHRFCLTYSVVFHTRSFTSVVVTYVLVYKENWKPNDCFDHRCR